MHASSKVVYLSVVDLHEPHVVEGSADFSMI